jgi:hypothetical protein
MTQKPSSLPAALVPVAPVQLQQPQPIPRAIAVEEALKIQSLLSEWVARAATSRIDTAQLLAIGTDLSTWAELLHLQEAFSKRLIQQQQAWLQGWVEWVHQREQLTSANTMSKLVEQKFNLAGQFGQLVSDQITNFMALLENAQVSYSYWVHEKLYPATVNAADTVTDSAVPKKAVRAA